MDSKKTFEQEYGLDEKYFIQTVNYVAKLISKGFAFGYHTPQDIYQTCFEMGLSALKKGLFDPAKGTLDEFMYTYLRSKLINLQRDKNYRLESPCRKCPHFDKNREVADNQCKAFEERRDCEPFRKYRDRNDAKSTLMSPAHDGAPDGGSLSGEICKGGDLATCDLARKIDSELPARLRPSYLKMLDGVKVSKENKTLVRGAIREILGGDDDWAYLLPPED